MDEKIQEEEAALLPVQPEAPPACREETAPATVISPESLEKQEALCQQLSLLENSQGLIRSIFLGLALQYKALDVQRCQLIAPQSPVGEGACNPKNLQIGASLIILSALFGFQNQAEQIAAQTCEAGVCPDMMDVKLGAIIILVALIRLFRLAAPPPAPTPGETPQQAQAETLEELELLSEPII